MIKKFFRYGQEVTENDKLLANTLKLLMTNDNVLWDAEKNLSIKWNDLSWKDIHFQVNNLRFRIFAAAKNKDWKRLRPLQRLMINSKMNLLTAVHRVTASSTGRKTPAMDQDTLWTPAEREAVFAELCDVNVNEWLPPPVKRIYLPKPDGRLRPIGIPTIKDRIIQAVVKNALEPEWEAYFEPSSYGFRPGKSYRDACAQLLGLMSKKTRFWVVEADIRGCFHNIDHEYLIDAVEKFPAKGLILKWLKAGILENQELKPTEAGTPQGGIVSPLLSNIALHGLEADLGIARDSLGYVTERNNPRGRIMVRYADEFVVLCPTQEEALATISDLNNVLFARGLQLSETKTKISHTFGGFDFLGFNFIHYINPVRFPPHVKEENNSIPRSHREFVTSIVTPSRKSMKNISDRIKKIFTDYKGKPTYSLIIKLNRTIGAYAESKRQFAFTKAARSLDNYIYHLQLSWIARRHPKKNRNWLVNNYFKYHVDGNIKSSWTFHCPETGIVLQKFHWNASRRTWPQVRGDMCPDDKDNREYWSNRASRIFASRCVNLASTADRVLISAQKFICPVCELRLFDEKGLRELHRHHIVPRSQGGKDSQSNLLILHSACQLTIHMGSNHDQWIERLRAYKNAHPTNKNISEQVRSSNPYTLSDDKTQKDVDQGSKQSDNWLNVQAS